MRRAPRASGEADTSTRTSPGTTLRRDFEPPRRTQKRATNRWLLLGPVEGHLPNSALLDQGGAQARRARRDPGPPARPSRGRAARQSIAGSRRRSLGRHSREPTQTERHSSLLAAHARLNVASELARMRRRVNGPGRPGARELCYGAGHLRINESLPAAGAHRPTLHRRNYLTSRSDE